MIKNFTWVNIQENEKKILTFDTHRSKLKYKNTKLDEQITKKVFSYYLQEVKIGWQIQ